MKHPNREQLIAFLYEDCEREEKSEIAQHLDSCASCRTQLQSWRATASALNAYTVAPSFSLWQTPGVKALRRSWLPLSAAAAVLIAAGITLGATWQSRASDQSHVIAELRARVEKSEAENARTQKLIVDLAQTVGENRTQNQAALLAVAKEVKATRKDLETVATLTQAGLVRLAGYTSDQR